MNFHTGLKATMVPTQQPASKEKSYGIGESNKRRHEKTLSCFQLTHLAPFVFFCFVWGRDRARVLKTDHTTFVSLTSVLSHVYQHLQQTAVLLGLNQTGGNHQQMRNPKLTYPSPLAQAIA